MLQHPESNQRSRSVLPWLVGLRHQLTVSHFYVGRYFSQLRRRGETTLTAIFCTGWQEYLLRGFESPTKFCDHPFFKGIRWMRAQGALGNWLVSLKILWESLSQISSVQEVSTFFSPKNGLLLSFHPNQRKEHTFLLVTKNSVKQLVSCLLGRPL